MSQLKIEGGARLAGKIVISGAKNAAIKILAAAVLADSASTISNVPKIKDITHIEEILRSVGVEVEVSGREVKIVPSSLSSYRPNPDLIRKLRGSVVIAAPLLVRFGQAIFSQPGGCLIGARPIDDHLDVFRQMGVKIKRQGEEYHLIGRPKAAHIILDKMSVSATENAILAAVLTSGKTRISVAAAEPEIVDLSNFLNKMGASINGAGTHEIEIEGVARLKGTDWSVMPDRIEAGTYLILAAATNSEVIIGPVMPEYLSIVFKKLTSAHARFRIFRRSGQYFIETKRRRKLYPVNIDTRTYPGFPTDLQSPYLVLMTQAQGTSRIFETLFEGRFLYLSELVKMKAKFEVLSPHIVQVFGPTQLRGRRISCADIRGGAALVIAALVAEGTTQIDQAEYIDRGYEAIDQKLARLGAKIERIEN